MKNQTNTRITSLRKGLAANLGLLSVSLIVALICSEWVVGKVAPQRMYRFPKGLFVSDPVLGYRLTPNFSGIADTGEYRVWLRTNSLGLRDDVNYTTKTEDVYRILALGDSFTMGVGVDLRESFVKLLEPSLQADRPERVQVVNAGVPGYNTKQALAYLRADGLRLKPDLVLLSLFVGNDVYDNFYEPRINVVEGYLTDGEPEAGLLPKWARRQFSRSHLYQLVWPYQQRLRDSLFATSRQKRRLSIYETQSSDELSEMWRATESELKATATLAATQNLRMVVVLIPERLQANPIRWQQSRREEGLASDPAQPNRKLVEYCRRHGLPVLDLLPAFQGDGTDVNYFRVDSHWNARGHRLAASWLLRFLQEEQLLAVRAVT